MPTLSFAFAENTGSTTVKAVLKNERQLRRQMPELMDRFPSLTVGGKLTRKRCEFKALLSAVLSTAGCIHCRLSSAVTTTIHLKNALQTDLSNLWGHQLLISPKELSNRNSTRRRCAVCLLNWILTNREGFHSTICGQGNSKWSPASRQRWAN